MSAQAPLRVFLVDDHEVVRRGFASMLTDDGLELVGQAGSAKEAEAMLPSSEADVAIVDVRLPDGDGIEVCRHALANCPEIRCLLVTSFADDEALFAAIMAGASGYLLKTTSADELIDAVRKVGEGGSLLDPALTTSLLERIRKGPFEEDERIASLSKQERKILELIADGLTNRQIAEQVFLAEATVKNYVSNLLAKLGLKRRTQAAILANELRHRRYEHSA